MDEESLKLLELVSRHAEIAEVMLRSAKVEREMQEVSRQETWDVAGEKRCTARVSVRACTSCGESRSTRLCGEPVFANVVEFGKPPIGYCREHYEEVLFVVAAANSRAYQPPQWALENDEAFLRWGERLREYVERRTR